MMRASAIATGALDDEAQAIDEEHPSLDASEFLENLRTLQSEVGDPDGEVIDARILDRLFDIGLFALTVPRTFGGLGADHRLFTQAMVEVGRMGAPYAITAVPHLCNGVKSIALFADEAIRKRVFDDVVHGRRLISFALTEEHTGSDVASLRSRLEAADDGGLRLMGSKLWVTNVSLAGHIVVVARCPTLSGNPKAAIFVLVPRTQAGLTVSHPWRKLNANACPTVSLFFDAAPIERCQLFGVPGGAIEHFNTIVETGRLGTAGGALGLAAGAWDSVANDPCVPREAFNDLAAEARLWVMQSVLAQSACYSDADYADHQITTAFCKAYCTGRAFELVRAMHERYADLGLPSPAMVAHGLKALPLFKVLEGPTEVICLHAGISLLTRFVSPAGRSDAEEAQGAVAHLLTRFHAALACVRSMSCLVAEQELVLAVADASMFVHAAVCMRHNTENPSANSASDIVARAQALALADARQALQRLEVALRDPPASRSQALFSRMPKEASECYRF